MIGTNIGEMDRRINLYNPTVAKSATGEPTRTFTLLKACFAKVEYSGGTENIITDAPTVTAEMYFTIRYCTGVTEKTRIEYHSVNYNITHIEEIGRKMFYKLSASKPDNE